MNSIRQKKNIAENGVNIYLRNHINNNKLMRKFLKNIYLKKKILIIVIKRKSVKIVFFVMFLKKSRRKK